MVFIIHESTGELDNNGAIWDLFYMQNPCDILLFLNLYLLSLFEGTG